MDNLHAVLRAIQPQAKSGRDHLKVFREFLAHLDTIKRKAPARRKPPTRRKRK